MIRLFYRIFTNSLQLEKRSTSQISFVHTSKTVSYHQATSPFVRLLGLAGDPDSPDPGEPPESGLTPPHRRPCAQRKSRIS